MATYELLKQEGSAKRAVFHTVHGDIQTPVFMNVGTVAAHECGHAIQHARGYVPLRLRTAFVPIANFGSMLAWPVIILGVIINSRSSMMLINIGILLFSFAVLFQLITLPVEFDASRRAMVQLREQGILGDQELHYTRKVLTAAALTYVASAAAAILQLLRIVLLFGGRSRDD